MSGLHKRLQQLRKEKGLNQIEFCRKAKKKELIVDVRRYRLIESGKTKVSLNEIATIVKALGISANELFGSYDDSSSPVNVDCNSTKKILINELREIGK